MKINSIIHTRYLLFFALVLFASAHTKAQEPTFSTNAPNAVVKGEQFRLTYTLLNAEGKDLKLNSEINEFDLLYGPSVSSSSNIQIINGKRSSTSSQSFIYILSAVKEGTFTLPGATIRANGKTYTSNPVQIKVLPPDKNSNQGQSGRNNSVGGGVRPSSASNSGAISSSDAFIRTIVSKTKIYEQEAFVVTFRFYTTLNVRNIGKIDFPEFNGFLVEDQELSPNRQLELDHYNGRNYYAVDLKRSLLFPQKSGQITIPSGKIEMTFNVPSGRAIDTFFGPQYISEDVTKVLTTGSLKIDVIPLPQNKPSNFANAVGSFSMNSSISANKVRANDAVTITLDISGTGNLKLIRTPELVLPSDFEEYDPKVTNNYRFTTKGFAGSKKIEYLFIPRHFGTFTIPPLELSFFDPESKSYKTLSTPEYVLTVDKDLNQTNEAATSYAQTDVKVATDIRYLKTGKPSFVKANDFIAGSFFYYLLHFVVLFLFLVILVVYRKRIKESADITALKSKRANKIAVKRLKQASKYLANNQKNEFYEEVLRATWGYLSDKLVIPVSELSRDNIEQELIRYGSSQELVTKVINILDKCEFAHYAPVESDAAMDNLYKDTVHAIGEMETTKQRKRTIL